MLKKGLAVVGVIVSVFLAWISIFFYSSLGLKLMDALDKDMYISLFTGHLKAFILFMVFAGASLAVLFAMLRGLSKLEGILMALAASVTSIIPVLIYGDYVGETKLYIWLSLFFVIGVTAKKLLVEEERRGIIRDINIGLAVPKLVFFFIAVGCLIGSYSFVKENLPLYEAAIRNQTIELAKDTAEVMTLDRDDVKAMVNKYLNPDSVSLSKGDVQDVFTKIDYEGVLRENYPDFDSMPEDEKELLRQSLASKVNSTFSNFNEDALKSSVDSSISGTVDMITDRVMDRYEQMDLDDQIVSTTERMIDDLPIFRTLIHYLPHLIAITAFSAVLICEILSGLVSGIIYPIISSFVPSGDKPAIPPPEKQETKSKPHNAKADKKR